MSDRSDCVGALEPYQHLTPPNWIYAPEYGKYIAYVLTPSGNAWITELEPNNTPGRISTTEPQLILIYLPNNIRLIATLRVFNRAQRHLYRPRHSEKFHAFVTTPNGIAYSGYLKLSSHRS